MKILKNKLIIGLLIGCSFLSSCLKDDTDDISPAEQLQADIKIIETYVASNNIQGVQSTASGLHYVIQTPGSGDNAPVGSTVSVHYTGTFLDGVKFDSSIDRNTPFSFTVGQGRVIAGWDEGLQLFNVGAKGLLLIPSGLAYGTSGIGSIGPNEVIIFEVELLSIN